MSDNNKKPVIKGELLSYGFAPYQDDPTQRQSYFAEIKHDSGITKKEWGVDLERALSESNVQIGDTVILNNLGRQPVNIPDPQDETKTKTVTKNLWEVEKYEPALDLPNAIEHDTEREQEKAVVLDKTKENEQSEPSTPNQTKKVPDLSEFDFELPDNIKNNYVGIVKNRYLLDQKTNYYDKDDKNQVNIAFEDRNKSLHTSRQDEKTIYAMLDMAQAKNWTAIKLKGTDEFKQKAWLEASLRGIEVKGYEPSEKDLAELKVRQAERTTNKVEMTAQKAPEPNQQAETVGTQMQKQEPVVLDIPAYHIVDNQKQDKAYLERVGVDFAGVKMERTASNFNEVKENAKDFTGRELTNFHSGIKAVISNNSLSKMLSGKAYEKSVDLKTHLMAVSNADKLFENSIFGWQHEHKGADKNSDIGAVHRAIAPLKIDDEVYLAKLTIKEFAYDGSRIYSIEAVELEDEKSPIPEMVANDLEYKAKTDRHNGALIDIIIKNAQEYNRQNQKNVEHLHNNNKENLKDVVKQSLETSQKTAKEIKNDIRQIFQAGYQDGSIKSRDELVEVLKERGFEVKENDKSIRVSLPNSDQAVNLKGEVFTKGYDAIKALKERLEPETLKQTYPTLKDSDIVHITAYKNKLFDDNKNAHNPKGLQTSLIQLETGIKELASGKQMNLPALPVNEIKPDIQVHTTKNQDKTRNR